MIHWIKALWMNVPSSMTILNNQSALVEHSVAMLLLNKQLENAYNDHHNIKKIMLPFFFTCLVKWL